MLRGLNFKEKSYRRFLDTERFTENQLKEWIEWQDFVGAKMLATNIFDH
jgi:hypothetical protein